jgi:rare lipoprotein A
MFIATVLAAAIGLTPAVEPTVGAVSTDSVAVEAPAADSTVHEGMRVDSVPILPIEEADSTIVPFSDSPQTETSDSDTTAAEDEIASDLGSGEASYYGEELAGRPTASGEIFDPEGLTAAHPTLPIGSMVRVTNLVNGRTVVVRINDRGPFIGGRIIDVSRGAAGILGMIGAGTALVRLHLLRR